MVVVKKIKYDLHIHILYKFLRILIIIITDIIYLKRFTLVCLLDSSSKTQHQTTIIWQINFHSCITMLHELRLMLMPTWNQLKYPKRNPVRVSISHQTYWTQKHIFYRKLCRIYTYIFLYDSHNNVSYVKHKRCLTMTTVMVSKYIPRNTIKKK